MSMEVAAAFCTKSYVRGRRQMVRFHLAFIFPIEFGIRYKNRRYLAEGL